MTPIQDIDTSTLLYEFARQFPVGASTFACCPACSMPSRGGHYCRVCIAGELQMRGASVTSLGAAEKGLISQQAGRARYEEAATEIRRQIERRGSEA